MRLTLHGQHLYQLTRSPRIFPVNCYLVKEQDGLTLIDTAIPGCEREILQAAGKIGLPITRIILTHAHFDHTGSLDALHTHLPGVEVVLGAREARLLAGDMHLDSAEPQARPKGSFQKVATQPTRLVAHGDRIASLQVVDSPGHTPGHIALWDRRDGSLIAGDAFQTRAGIAVAGVLRPWFPFPALGTWNRPLALQSACTLQALNPSRLATGHGEVLENPGTEIKAAIAVAERAFEKEKVYST